MKEEGGGVAFLVCDPHTHTHTPVPQTPSPAVGSPQPPPPVTKGSGSCQMSSRHGRAPAGFSVAGEQRGGHVVRERD